MKKIQEAYKCEKCKEYIVGEYHNMASCSCNKVAIDVGSLHTRIVGDLQFAKDNWENFYLEEKDSIEDFKSKLLWGTYGLNEEGESLLDIWAEKQPSSVKSYYSARRKSYDVYLFPSIKDFLTKDQYEKYLKWEDSRPKKYYMLMSEMDASHIIAIIETQTQISEKIKKAFKLELKERGIDVTNI